MSQEEILKKLLSLQFKAGGSDIIPLKKVRSYLSIICTSFEFFDYLTDFTSVSQTGKPYYKCNNKAFEIVKSLYGIDKDVNGVSVIMAGILRNEHGLNFYAKQAKADIRVFLIDEILKEL